MNESDVLERLKTLTTAHLADAFVRLGRDLRCAPHHVKGLTPGMHCAGRCRPTRHAGSVDVFLEAIASASAGDVLVVDNEGRLDEACVGDLVAREAKQAGLAGIVIWGLHRDTTELLEIGLPCFSLGTLPNGPLRARQRHPEAMTTAEVGTCVVSAKDVTVADADGIIFLAQHDPGDVLTVAEGIRETERRQAQLMHGGRSLRDQTRFVDYLRQANENPNYTFREHLRTVAGAIET